VIETQPRPTIRTLVASFLFTDLVGFSKGTAADQYAAKANLSAVLRRHLAALKESDYWIKDTGDGALIAFVSNPEHALYMALALGHDYGASAGADEAPSARLRTGLHLGTVKESIDVEARRNFIGDGINAAKRIMDFALPGQIAASRSFFEAIANLDAAYAALFQHLGAPDDKHGRAHELYALATSDSVLEKLRGDIAAEAGSAGDGQTAGSAAASAKPAAATDSRPSAARILRPTLLVAVLALAAIAAAFFLTQMRESSPTARSGIDAASGAAGGPGTVRGAAATDNRGAPAGAAVGASTPEPTAPTPRPVDVQPNRAPAAPRSSDTAERSSGESPRAGPVSPATKPMADRPRPSAAPASPQEASGASSPRCSRILQKAALGEPLTSDEKRELANTCR